MLSASRAARTLVGLVQFIGLFLFALSFAGILTAGGDPEIADPVPIRGIGLSLLFVPIPIQFALTYFAFRLRRVPVQIGDRAKYGAEHSDRWP